MAAKHPENRGERSPLASRKIQQQLKQNRFVKTSKGPRAGTEVDLPATPKPELPAGQPAQPPQPQPGDPVPVQ